MRALREGDILGDLCSSSAFSAVKSLDGAGQGPAYKKNWPFAER
jgi:hypothetical protein